MPKNAPLLWPSGIGMHFGMEQVASSSPGSVGYILANMNAKVLELKSSLEATHAKSVCMNGDLLDNILYNQLYKSK